MDRVTRKEEKKTLFPKFVPLRNISDIRRSIITINPGQQLKQRPCDKQLLDVLKSKEISNITDCHDIKFHLDLSSVNYIELSTLLWIMALLSILKTQNCQINLTLPNINERNGWRVWSFLHRWKFFNALTEWVGHPYELLPESQIEWLEMVEEGPKYKIALRPDENGVIKEAYRLGLLTITNFAARNEFIEDIKNGSSDSSLFRRYINLWQTAILSGTLQELCGWSTSEAEEFAAQIVFELLRNATIHSGCRFVLGAFDSDSKHVLFSVADNGIGIPESLRTAFKKNENLKSKIGLTDAELIKHFTTPEMVLDSELIRLSTRSGISAHSHRAGAGLYYCKRLLISRSGELRIRSGHACVDFDRNQPEGKAIDELMSVHSTVIRAMIPRNSRE